MRRVGQHFETLDGVRFERTVEHQEAIECQSALDVVTVQILDLGVPVRMSQEQVEVGANARELTLLGSVFMTL